MSNPGAGTKWVAGKDANKFDDSVMVTTAACQPAVFEFSAR